MASLCLEEGREEIALLLDLALVIFLLILQQCRINFSTDVFLAAFLDFSSGFIEPTLKYLMTYGAWYS